MKLCFNKNCVVLMMYVFFLASCATTQTKFTRLDTIQRTPKAKDSKIEIFESHLPEKHYTEIARLDVHLEKSHFVSSSLHNALPLLIEEARKCGADAIIEIKERSSRIVETRVYHVTATAIIFN